jgi:hypothetical protein
MVNEAPLNDLIGTELSGICLVRDYLEFHFDGPKLTALTDPYGQLAGQDWRFPDEGSLEQLRRYIGLPVVSTEITEGDQDPHPFIALHFAVGNIVIPLGMDARVGPEAAHFFPADERGRVDVRRMHIW